MKSSNIRRTLHTQLYYTKKFKINYIDMSCYESTSPFELCVTTSNMRIRVSVDIFATIRYLVIIFTLNLRLTALASHGFRHTGPSIRNSLPPHLRSIDTYTAFKSNPKTHLFCSASISGP